MGDGGFFFVAFVFGRICFVNLMALWHHSRMFEDGYERERCSIKVTVVQGKVPELKRCLSENRGVPIASQRGEILLTERILRHAACHCFNSGTVSDQGLCLVHLIRADYRAVEIPSLTVEQLCRPYFFYFMHLLRLNND